MEDMTSPKDDTGINRLERVRVQVDTVLYAVEDKAWQRKFFVHLYGVAECAALLAKKRGLDAELAIVAGLLHDISAAKRGDYDNHCVLSAEMARNMLIEMGIFTVREMEQMYAAIFNHDFRDRTDAPFDEVLKDADILHPYLQSLVWPLNEPTKRRLESMMAELGMLQF